MSKQDLRALKWLAHASKCDHLDDLILGNAISTALSAKPTQLHTSESSRVLATNKKPIMKR